MRLTLIGLACVAAATAATPALANCEMRYSSQLSQAAASAHAKISSNSLRSIADSVESALAGRESARLRLDARYAVFAAGGLAQQAYSETISSFFCSLYEHFADQPEKVAKLRDAEHRVRLALSRYFDIGLWQIEAVQARRDEREELLAVGSAPSVALVTREELAEALPSPNFDLVRLREISGNVTFPGLEAGICAGFLTSSVRRVDPSILSSLGLIRPMLVKWLTGDEVGARVDLWEYAETQMSNQLARAHIVQEQNVTPQFLVCVQRAEAAAIAAEAQTAPPVPQPITPAAQPATQPVVAPGTQPGVPPVTQPAINPGTARSTAGSPNTSQHP